MTLEPKTKNRTPLYWFGFLLTVGGTVCVVHYILRQLDKAGTGQTYYGFIAGGFVVAVVGGILMTRSRRNPSAT